MVWTGWVYLVWFRSESGWKALGMPAVGSGVSALVAGRTPCPPGDSLLLALSVSLPVPWLLVDLCGV